MFAVLLKGIETEQPSLEDYSFREFVEKITSEGKPALWRERSGVLSGKEITSSEYMLYTEGHYKDVRGTVEQIVEKSLATEKARELSLKFRLSIEVMDIFQERPVENIEVWLVASYKGMESSGYEKEEIRHPVTVEAQRKTA